MLNIAICDDDPKVIDHISNLFDRYKNEKSIVLKYKAFSNSFDLLETMQKYRYDILLLDVLMPGIDGMQTAHEIRKFDKDLKIIFLTSSPEFAVESYAVDAHYYLLKPATADKLFPIIDRLFQETQKTIDSLYIKTGFGIIRIPFDKLEFLEVIGKKLYFHFLDASVKEIYGSLSDFEAELLSRQEFIKVHRSYIVNMGCIQEISSRELITNARQRVPVSRLLYPQLKEAYMNYLFVEKGVK